jgi:chromosome segregation ATPase
MGIEARSSDLSLADQRAIVDGATLPELKSHLKDAWGEISSLKKQCAHAEQTTDLRQEELDKLEAKNQELMKELEKYRSEATSSKPDVELQKKLDESLRKEEKALKDLSEARDHIFRLQPQRPAITETGAQKQFQELFGSVQRWVQHRLADILDDLDNGKLKKVADVKSASNLLTLASKAAKKYSAVRNTDEYHIVAIIMQYLYEMFFSKKFYCSLDGKHGGTDNVENLIHRVYSGMRRLPRGKLPNRQRLVPRI